MNEQSIRLENLRGGNTPDYIFAGIIKTKALNGDFQAGSTVFKNLFSEVSLADFPIRNMPADSPTPTSTLIPNP